MSHHKQRYCKKSQPVNDDLLDNDCDGKIDEEYYDQKDNDRDGKVDEDFRDLTEEQRKEKEQRESSHMSAWSEWTEWTCPRECNATDRYRTRQCHKPTPSSENCLGLANETKHGGCNVENELCPVGEKQCPVVYCHHRLVKVVFVTIE
uniref:Uncharacterized protein n=1 Tax=Biomphalaria glabrata TaxID=6526 RepID=A0A2C9L4N5_BIOGL